MERGFVWATQCLSYHLGMVILGIVDRWFCRIISYLLIPFYGQYNLPLQDGGISFPDMINRVRYPFCKW